MSLRSPTSRIRPYVTGGPALQMLNVGGSTMHPVSGLLRFGLHDIGLVRAALHYSNAPPLDGGAILQGAVQYGGGVKFRVTPRWMARFDFRETLSRQPDFWSKSLKANQVDLFDSTVKISPVQLNGPWRQQRVSLAFLFTF